MPHMEASNEINVSNMRVAELRKFLGLTMAEFAEILGYNQSYISQIESGKRDVTGQMITRLWEKFHIKAASIFEGDYEAAASHKQSDRKAAQGNSGGLI